MDFIDVIGPQKSKSLHSSPTRNKSLNHVRFTPDIEEKLEENENSTLAVKEYVSLARSFNLEPVHMALAFCNQRPFMGSVIFGATDKLQLTKIIKGLDIVLSDELLDEINKLYKKFPITF